MVTATYNHYYGLQPSDFSGSQVTIPHNLGHSGTNTLSDNADGNDDGTLAISGHANWTEVTNFHVVLLAVTAEGYPIVQHGGNAGRFILTPVGGLHNQTFTINTTDPYIFCFAAGTQIATAQGERSVEDLKIGDLVMNAQGRAVPVLWLGKQTIHKAFTGLKGQLVRIRAGALGAGLPHSDLVVTADHGMILDGLVINASALVNGDTIDWMPLDEMPDSYTVYHIETEAHDVILANGAETESFIDAAGRKAFDNYAEYLDLYRAERIIPEMDVPRISAPRLVPSKLAARLSRFGQFSASSSEISQAIARTA